jgi:hypothetical protein
MISSTYTREKEDKRDYYEIAPGEGLASPHFASNNWSTAKP